jgi:hypothetical protein
MGFFQSRRKTGLSLQLLFERHFVRGIGGVSSTHLSKKNSLAPGTERIEDVDM